MLFLLIFCVLKYPACVFGIWCDSFICVFLFKQDDEFVVYNTEQIRLKYVVRYSLQGDELKEFQPHINTQLTQLTDTTADVCE